MVSNGQACPLYPQKRTFGGAKQVSALGQKWTHAAQQPETIASMRKRAWKDRWPGANRLGRSLQRSTPQGALKTTPAKTPGKSGTADGADTLATSCKLRFRRGKGVRGRASRHRARRIRSKKREPVLREWWPSKNSVMSCNWIRKFRLGSRLGSPPRSTKMLVFEPKSVLRAPDLAR